jgi:hydroxyacylglutathione hydrolase
MRALIVPCLRDNFTFLIGAPGDREVAVVDPSEPEAVLRAIEHHGLRVVAILNTHHHGDHVGGNTGLLARFPGIPVYAHSTDQGRIPGQTHLVNEGDEVRAAGLHFKVLFIPGHTRGHIAYVTDSAAFVGDTLFGAGCGRLFEGTAEQLHHSLNTKLANLPDHTQLYFGHEYTANNLRFAIHIEPGNRALQTRQAEVDQARAAGLWTCPTTLELEKQTNPFLRVTAAEIVARCAGELGVSPTPLEVFTWLRSSKDKF